MTRDQFEHAVRAAGAILGANEILVIGSQALHASVADALPPEALRSVEVDVAVPDDHAGEMADLIDGSIGEGSMFHGTFGYYARGVVEQTAVLPDDWRERLIRFETPATNGVVAWCLEPHDLWISKAIASPPKDLEFCAALLRAGIVNPGVLKDRLTRVPNLDPSVMRAVRARIPDVNVTK